MVTDREGSRHSPRSAGGMLFVAVQLDVASPILGFLFGLVIFLKPAGLDPIGGGGWLATGGLCLRLKTRSVAEPIETDFSES